MSVSCCWKHIRYEEYVKLRVKTYSFENVLDLLLWGNNNRLITEDLLLILSLSASLNQTAVTLTASESLSCLSSNHKTINLQKAAA